MPSQCAADLAAGSADIGIIPAAAYASIPGLAILPGVAIASRRPVRSILLVSKVPLDQIRVGCPRHFLPDIGSADQGAVREVVGRRAGRFTPMAPDIEKMMEAHDAGLVIGDPALKVDRSRYLTYDLAEEWIRLTGKPFVFRLLGGAASSVEGCARGPRSGGSVSGFARPRPAAGES